jgi:large subunit ribosomal protein L10
LDRNQKAAAIEEVAGQISESNAVFAVDYRGISVPQAAELRTKLRESDASFRVVKNTLTERAADQAGADGLKDFLQGPTAMTFVRGDAAAAAKSLHDFARTSGLLAFKGGWMDGRPLTADQIVSISRLPSREVLYAQLVGLVASPITGLAVSLSGLISGLGRQLQQIHDQGLVTGTAAAAAPSGAEAEAATDVTVEASDETTEATDPAEATPSATSDDTPSGDAPEAAADTTETQED